VGCIRVYGEVQMAESMLGYCAVDVKAGARAELKRLG
jgi:hypothetical protein